MSSHNKLRPRQAAPREAKGLARAPAARTAGDMPTASQKAWLNQMMQDEAKKDGGSTHAGEDGDTITNEEEGITGYFFSAVAGAFSPFSSSTPDQKANEERLKAINQVRAIQEDARLVAAAAMRGDAEGVTQATVRSPVLSAAREGAAESATHAAARAPVRPTARDSAVSGHVTSNGEDHGELYSKLHALAAPVQIKSLAQRFNSVEARIEANERRDKENSSHTEDLAEQLARLTRVLGDELDSSNHQLHSLRAQLGTIRSRVIMLEEASAPLSQAPVDDQGGHGQTRKPTPQHKRNAPGLRSSLRRMMRWEVKSMLAKRVDKKKKQESLVDKLQALANLFDNKYLTAEEYTTAKRKLLSN